jgi:hypothetical protein
MGSTTFCFSPAGIQSAGLPSSAAVLQTALPIAFAMFKLLIISKYQYSEFIKNSGKNLNEYQPKRWILWRNYLPS